MDQNKVYETVTNITVKAIERVDKIYTEEIDRRKEIGKSSVDLMRDYVGALAAAASILTSTALLRPLPPFPSGFCAGLAKEERQ